MNTMKSFLLLLLLPLIMHSQEAQVSYEASAEQPFGKLNPEAPKEVGDYAALIGTCDCVSTKRNPDQSWGTSQKMTWTFKYIMNGTAVQDETLKEDGSHSGSIRQFIADSSKWYVHWFSNISPSTTFPTWSGGMEEDNIVLYRPQKAPNGMEGQTRLSFKDISIEGFNWALEWIDEKGTIVYPTWKIECKKRNKLTDKEVILKNIANYSQAYVKLDAKAISQFYAEDAKILPSDSEIVSGQSAIEKNFNFTEGTTNRYHNVTPVEIIVNGNIAHDYGLYESGATDKEGNNHSFKGKYMIVWKRVNDDWKIHLDIWN